MYTVSVPQGPQVPACPATQILTSQVWDNSNAITPSPLTSTLQPWHLFLASLLISSYQVAFLMPQISLIFLITAPNFLSDTTTYLHLLYTSPSQTQPASTIYYMFSSLDHIFLISALLRHAPRQIYTSHVDLNLSPDHLPKSKGPNRLQSELLLYCKLSSPYSNLISTVKL